MHSKPVENQTNSEVECSICSVVMQPHLEKNHLSIYQCANCEFVKAYDAEHKNLQNGIVDTNPDFYESSKSQFVNQTLIAKNILKDRIPEYSKYIGGDLESILEIGCGTGAYGRAYQEAGVDYTAIEVDKTIADFARENSNSKIISDDFINHSFENKFSVVFASQVFEHIMEPYPFLNKVSDVLTDNGIVHFDVPNHNSIISRMRKLYHGTDWGFIQPPYHMIAYNEKSIRRVLENSGFELLFTGNLKNNHATWGQLVNPSAIQKTIYNFTGILDMGSLLTIIAKKSPSDN